MAGTSGTIRTSAGEIACIDYGGSGVPVLLVHDIFENAEAWRVVGRRLAAFCHPIALDSFGHGQTTIAPPDPATAYRLLGEAADALGFHRPVLVGQGVGGWDLTACTILGEIRPRGLVLLEASYPGTREVTESYVAQFANPEVFGYVVERFGLGAQARSEAERDALVDRLVAAADSDWMQSAQHREVLRASAVRSFVRQADGWVRQPLPDDLATVIALPDDLDPFPCREAYERLDVPVWMMMASDGIYNDDPDAAEALVHGRPERRLTILPTTRNISATHPLQVASAIRDLLEYIDAAA